MVRAQERIPALVFKITRSILFGSQKSPKNNPYFIRHRNGTRTKNMVLPLLDDVRTCFLALVGETTS
jgi:hypothetical protein